MSLTECVAEFIPSSWPLKSGLSLAVPLRVILVANYWRGCGDVLAGFARSLGRIPGVDLLVIDWRVESWLMHGESRTVRAAQLDRVASSFGAELVVLAGAGLALDVLPENERTYVNYQVSSLSNLSDEHREQILLAHFAYQAHTADLQGAASWLPFGIDIELSRTFLKHNARNIEYQVCAPWNIFQRPKDEHRMRWLEELEQLPLSALIGGKGTGADEIWSLELYHAIYRSRITIDHNLDLLGVSAQFNCRFLLAASLGCAVASIPNTDLCMCFSAGKDFLPLAPNESLCETILRYNALADHELHALGESARRRAERDHTWLQRWAKILEDHFARKELI